VLTDQQVAAVYRAAGAEDVPFTTLSERLDELDEWLRSPFVAAVAEVDSDQSDLMTVLGLR
jgi:hypothetical protein